MGNKTKQTEVFKFLAVLAISNVKKYNNLGLQYAEVQYD